MKRVVFDTNLYIDWINRARVAERSTVSSAAMSRELVCWPLRTLFSIGLAQYSEN
jgi:hypothetical protein